VDGGVKCPRPAVCGYLIIARDLSHHRRGEAEQLRLLRLNTHAESLLGCEARAAEGKPLSDFPQVAFIAPRHLCDQVWRTGRTHDDEVNQLLPGKGRRWFRRQLCAVGDCMAVTVRDITAQRENEVRLRLNERMASIGMLAAGVAHEINNPLAFVSSNLSNLGFIGTELRRLSLPEEDGQELMEALNEAREGTERMRLIVESLKALSRGDTATTHPLELHEVLENSVHLAWGRLRSRGRLVRDYGELPQVLGNSVQLAQVFTNLESIVGQGSTFRVLLPVAHEHEAEEPRSEDPRSEELHHGSVAWLEGFDARSNHVRATHVTRPRHPRRAPP